MVNIEGGKDSWVLGRHQEMTLSGEPGGNVCGLELMINEGVVHRVIKSWSFWGFE